MPQHQFGLLTPRRDPKAPPDFVRVPLELLKDPITLEALDYWRAKRGTRALPLASDFDPAEVPRILANITVLDVSGSPRTFFYKIVGEAYKRATGLDRTGHTMEILNSLGLDFRRQVEQYLNEVCDQKEAGAMAGDLSRIDRAFYRFEGVHLPFAGKDGEVTRVIGVTVYYAHAVP